MKLLKSTKIEQITNIQLKEIAIIPLFVYYTCILGISCVYLN